MRKDTLQKLARSVRPLPKSEQLGAHPTALMRLRRLKRDAPDVAKLVAAGEIQSLAAAERLA